MIGVDLFYNLLNACSSNHSIVITGDPSQLPSLSNGNLMKEVINCDNIPSQELGFVFRNQSTILKNANQIRNGQSRLVYNDEFSRWKTDVPIDAILSIFEDPRNTTVLSGLRKGPNGVIKINKAVQKKLGRKGSVSIGQGYRIQEDDKVIHTVNDYTKGVFNGNIGYVKTLHKDGTVDVLFDDGLTSTVIEYKGKTDLEKLELAYCVSVHKAQGSEIDNIILVLDKSHWMVQGRNWFYTAITRAKTHVSVVGNMQVPHMCVGRGDQSDTRNSKLALRIDQNIANIKQGENNQ
jgi:exodeoxyribonuclease V alpha subunit